ncbi:hypothetical protein FISHEDRAFT_75855 [Fistulina hepatica ATCC 64428]|uniref:Uncharacterized protein n=1 Tax=Fistulina hepatica ATCC 64428 TaxID=1128425 RepID=A0A0D7A5B4_9AGAR|nr:hypothetical protein FISHEDRAFT_75855 [Fistulina hepatica ATCC 64428]
MRFIEDRNGDMVDGFQASEIRRAMQSVWQMLLTRGLAPKTWGAASSEALAIFHGQMNIQCPELALCQNNWKATEICTANYPSWASTHLPSGSKAVKRERESSTLPISLKRTLTDVVEVPSGLVLPNSDFAGTSGAAAVADSGVISVFEESTNTATAAVMASTSDSCPLKRRNIQMVNTLFALKVSSPLAEQSGVAVSSALNTVQVAMAVGAMDVERLPPSLSVQSPHGTKTLLTTSLGRTVPTVVTSLAATMPVGSVTSVQVPSGEGPALLSPQIAPTPALTLTTSSARGSPVPVPASIPPPESPTETPTNPNDVLPPSLTPNPSSTRGPPSSMQDPVLVTHDSLMHDSESSSTHGPSSIQGLSSTRDPSSTPDGPSLAHGPSSVGGTQGPPLMHDPSLTHTGPSSITMPDTPVATETATDAASVTVPTPANENDVASLLNTLMGPPALSQVPLPPWLSAQTKMASVVASIATPVHPEDEAAMNTGNQWKSKGPARMKPTKSSTPRNLCAIDWCKQHPNGTVTEYAEYWESIKSTDEAQKYVAASKNARNAKQPQHHDTRRADARAQEETHCEQAATAGQDEANNTLGPTKPKSDKLDRDRILKATGGAVAVLPSP